MSTDEKNLPSFMQPIKEAESKGLAALEAAEKAVKKESPEEYAKKENPVAKKETKKASPEAEKALGSALTEGEKEKIREEALSELEAENKKKLAEEYKKAIKLEAQKKLLFADADVNAAGDGLVPIFIDLPPVAECIRLDGRCYYPGRTYNVTKGVRDVIMEVMGRGQEHEDEVSGRKDSNFMRKKRNLVARLGK